jgi:diamine N-acetyltransferase
MEIIKPRLNDIPQLLLLWREQYSFHHNLDSEYYVANSDELDKRLSEYLVGAINEDKPNILVAKEGRHIIGFITFEDDSENYFDTNIEKFGVIVELFISEAERRKNIGKLLMNAAEDYFISKGLHHLKIQCSTFNNYALNFYNHLGYKNRQSLFYKKI